jgi:hypothetical protein
VTEFQSMSDLEIPQIVPEGFDILQAQRSLQHRVVAEHGVSTDHVPGEKVLTWRELMSAIRWSQEQLVREHVEMIEAAPGKGKDWKKAYHEGLDQMILDADRLELKFEAIDRLHFLLNEMINLGFESWDEVQRWYLAKNKENFKRQDSGY